MTFDEIKVKQFDNVKVLNKVKFIFKESGIDVSQLEFTDSLLLKWDMIKYNLVKDYLTTFQNIKQVYVRVLYNEDEEIVLLYQDKFLSICVDGE